jgi:uncharacterized protein involved in exopolysaccharide biosynthesis
MRTQTDGDQSPHIYQDDVFGQALLSLARQWKRLGALTLLAAIVSFGVTFLIRPTFTAKTTFLPPQQQQGAAASLLSSLGSLSSLTGMMGGSVHTPADQYVSLLESRTVADRMVEAFDLVHVYDEKYNVDARKDLAKNSRFSLGKKDGLISIEVDDHSPTRAAAMANSYVDELRKISDTIAITEAQQRRMFFENLLRQTQQKLADAQAALQATGVSEGAIKSEPAAAASSYAKLKAEETAAEVRLQVLRRTLTDSAAEVRQQQAAVEALRRQLLRLEEDNKATKEPDYVGRYREFRYQETLFELYAREYEMARVDESREGGLIQVIDKATPPEKKSRPQRLIVSLAAAAMTFILCAGFMLVRERWRGSKPTATDAPAPRP